MISLGGTFHLTVAFVFVLTGLCVGCGSPSAGGSGPAHGRSTGFVNTSVEMPDGTTRRYVVFVPADYSADRTWPAILFLHGAGERGDDNKGQVRVGIGTAIRQREATWPFVTVMPQCAPDKWWTDDSEKGSALAALAKSQAEYNIDPRRVYLTGLSMGGHGTWALAVDHPKKWAAIVPICGKGDPAKVGPIADIPCWCFHGADDETVPPKHSHDMIAAIKKCGGRPRYTEYAGVGHNSWDRAYETDELYTWMLSKRCK